MTPTSAPRPPQILVLDDEPGVARLQQMSLEDAGYRVAVAHVPEDASVCVKAGDCDLMVLDYRLNHALTGLDFYKRMKAEGCELPAIMVTGFSDESRVLEALRAGVRDVVPKSGEYLEYLPKAVERILAQVAAERQLRETEQLKHANQVKDEFLATLAHELRNPLAPIRYALALLDDIDRPQHVRAKETIDRQVTHLVRLVDDLLDLSRITRNKIRLHKEPVSLRSVIGAALETTAPLAEVAGQRLVVSKELPDVWLHADGARLTQVFANLFNNASKYSPRGTAITVWGDTRDGHVRVGVRDQGRGIASEHLDHLFDMFYQVGDSAQLGAGLGIGLTLVRRLVEMHDGRVEASSAGTGQGAEFIVTLPVAEKPTAFVEVTAPERTKEAVGRQRVLIADDNVDAADLLTLVVESVGHDVCTAHDGPSAIAAFRQYRPRVALLDIGLPGADGYELAREFRRISGPDVFLVAITGWGQDEDRRRAREAGFDCHLLKPADPRVIERLLSVPAGQRCNVCGNCLTPED